MPDQTLWPAYIKAILRVIHITDPRTHLEIVVQNQTIAWCYDNRWINADGSYAEDYDLAREIFIACKNKDIFLSVKYSRPDRQVKNLQLRSKAAAYEKDALLSPVQRKQVPANRGAQPFNQLGGFPPVEEGDEDGPTDQ